MHGDNSPIDPTTAEIPVSTGFPIVVRLALAGAILIVLIIMGMTAGSSMIGHIWPWSHAESIPLSS